MQAHFSSYSGRDGRESDEKAGFYFGTRSGGCFLI